ncbi:MAG: hypothetical protein LUP00_03020, partial [Methanothrix sp.]|nr:hypothetical protein [Methanothrix sp.]
MKSNWLAFSLAMLAVTGLYPGLAACSSLSQSMGEESWAVYDDEIESFQLAEDAAGPSVPGDDAPGLAITDSSGRQSRDSLEMPSGSLVRIRLTPGASGDLQLFCLYPTGSVAGILNGSVEKDRSYSTWMQAELQGDYELWFVVNGARSNSAKIRVLEAEAMQDSLAGQTGMLSGVRAPALSYSMAAPATAAGAGP